MRIMIHSFISAMVFAVFIFPSAVCAKPMQFSDQGVELTLTDDGTNLVSLKIQGIETPLLGTEKSATWEVRVLDEPNRKRNDTPLYPPRQKYYWFTVWRDSSRRITSRDAKMVSHYWNASKHQLTLNYKHPLVNVSLRYLFSAHRLDMQAVVTNKGPDPLSHVNVPLNWQLTYQPEQTVLVPHSGTGVEYTSLKGRYPFWMCNSAWDGALINGPSDLLGFYRVQHQKTNPWLATETNLAEVKGMPRTLVFRSGTVIYRKTGESVQTVMQSIGRYANIRQYADEYLERNFPDMPTLAEKIAPDLRETLASAVHLPVNGRFKDLAKIAKQLPGHFIFHTPDYMHTPPGGGNSFDSFPNYFPPSKAKGGSMAELAHFIKEAHQAGHLYLPRNSFFYWVEKSDVDQDGKLHQMAIRRVNGLPRTAKWGRRGILTSPSSKRANQYLRQFLKQWKDLGADLDFTNVLGAMAPYGNRYDFHPDAPGPDLLYDQIKNVIAFHNKELPMLTEEGGLWLLPYQIGYFHSPGWNPQKPSHATHLYNGLRGEFLGFREEMQTYFTHQYAMMLPHNLGFSRVSDSPRKLTYSFLYGIQLKYGLPRKVLTPKTWRWLRTLGLLGKTVQKQIWGTRLDHFTRQADGIERADYQGNKVVANFSKKPYTFTKDGQIHTLIPDGFHFTSKDGKLTAGWYSQFNGMQLRPPQLMVIQRDEGTQNIFVPLAQQEVELFIPVAPSKTLAAFVQTQAQTEKPLPLLKVRNGLLLKIPPFEVGPGTFIPHVQLRGGKPVLAHADPIQIHASWAKTHKTALRYQFGDDLPTSLEIELEVNHLGSQIRQSQIQIKGLLFGKPWSQQVDVTITPGSQSIRLPIASVPSESSSDFSKATELSLTLTNLKPFVQTLPLALSLKFDPPPRPATMAEAQKIVSIYFDFAGIRRDFPKMVSKRTAVTQTRKGLRLHPGSSMDINAKQLRFGKRVYLECVVKFHTLSKNAEQHLFIAKTPRGKIGRSIELRYNPRFNALRFLITTEHKAFSDLTAFKIPIKPGRWYHVIAYADGQKQILRINDEQVEKPLTDTFQKWVGPWRIGTRGLDATFSHLRIGGD